MRRLHRKRCLQVVVPAVFVLGVALSTVRGTAQIPDYTTLMSKLGSRDPMVEEPVPSEPMVVINGRADGLTNEVLSVYGNHSFLIAQFKKEVNNDLCATTLGCIGSGVPPLLDAAPTRTPVVQLDGTTLGDPALTNAACATIAQGIVSRHLVDWTNAYEQAAAWVVLQQLLYEQAQTDGHVVSDAQARTAAEAERDVYVHDQNPGKPQIAPGQTVDEVFLSVDALSARKIGMSIAAEKRALLQRALGSHYSLHDGSLFLLNWFADQLRVHTVSISGLPAFSLAQALPIGTM